MLSCACCRGLQQLGTEFTLVWLAELSCVSAILLWVKLVIIIVFVCSLAGNPCSCRSANYFCFIWHFLEQLSWCSSRDSTAVPRFLIMDGVLWQLSAAVLAGDTSFHGPIDVCESFQREPGCPTQSVPWAGWAGSHLEQWLIRAKPGALPAGFSPSCCLAGCGLGCSTAAYLVCSPSYSPCLTFISPSGPSLYLLWKRTSLGRVILGCDFIFILQFLLYVGSKWSLCFCQYFPSC